MLERLGAFVGGFLFAAEDHDDAALGIELDDHVGAFVGDPNVVFFIDAHGMGEGPSVEVVANLAKELSVRGKFEKLSRGGSVGGTAGVAAREDEDVSLGVAVVDGLYTKPLGLRLRSAEERRGRWDAGNEAKCA